MGHNGWLPALIGVGALTIMGLALLFAAIGDAKRAGAVTADAEVTYVGRRGQDLRSNEYRFVVKLDVDGQSYSAGAIVSWSFANDYEKGDTIPVQYDPENPERIWIVPVRAALWYGPGRWGGFWVAVLMAWWCWGLWKLSARTVGALESSERQTAIVTAHVDASGKKQDMSRVSIVWRDASGMPMESKPMSPEKAAQYPVGSEIELFVDRDNKQGPRGVEEYR
jgi:hypothetical protein